MIATELAALVVLGLVIGSSEKVQEPAVTSMVKDVIEATPEPLLFPGERMFWLRQTWEEGRWLSSPHGSNDHGVACGVTQVNTFVIPKDSGVTCDDLRKSRVLAITTARAILRPYLTKCSSVRAALGAYMTGGKCGSAPKLVAKRCSDGAC